MTPLEKEEVVFQEYCRTHGLEGWENENHEPDYREMYGLSTAKQPDFLVRRDKKTAIFEVKGFQRTELEHETIRENLKTGEAFCVPDRKGTIRNTIKNGKKQLEPFKELDVPLVIVLIDAENTFVKPDAEEIFKEAYGLKRVEMVSMKGDYEGPMLVPRSEERLERTSKQRKILKNISAIVILNRVHKSAKTTPMFGIEMTHTFDSTSLTPDEIDRIGIDGTLQATIMHTPEDLLESVPPLPPEFFQGENDAHWYLDPVSKAFESFSFDRATSKLVKSES